MKKTTEQLMSIALKSVNRATGLTYSSISSSELRRVLIELAEDGAWSEYEGDGEFDGVHIDEMSDREIANILIRDYEIA
ncbi:hypothetical protein BC351_00475 [Paenibacillus ferrarius]|uniref:Uncharacterized protein n=1 Tax=Paenibacillus ferrarius TaxID=1469647 RepID=A0A1V4HS47_9BACL|nr:hypothetical protein [Paenibacillus ferrarius]OPH61751.1 hypothetical protein BC351_00475 [Paenibacillus ferrarius]